MANHAKQTETVIARGAAAYRAGQSLGDCPYTVLSKQGQKFAKLWRLGYTEARASAVGVDERLTAQVSN